MLNVNSTLETFSLILKLCLLVFNIVVDSLANAIRRNKKSVRVEKEETELMLLADDMTVCLENPRQSTNYWNPPENSARLLIQDQQ